MHCISLLQISDKTPKQMSERTLLHYKNPLEVRGAKLGHRCSSSASRLLQSATKLTPFRDGRGFD